MSQSKARTLFALGHTVYGTLRQLTYETGMGAIALSSEGAPCRGRSSVHPWRCGRTELAAWGKARGGETEMHGPSDIDDP